MHAHLLLASLSNSRWQNNKERTNQPKKMVI